MYFLKNTVKTVKLQKNSNLQENCEIVIFLNLSYILVFYLAPHLPVLIRQEFIKIKVETVHLKEPIHLHTYNIIPNIRYICIFAYNIHIHTSSLNVKFRTDDKNI